MNVVILIMLVLSCIEVAANSGQHRYLLGIASGSTNQSAFLPLDEIPSLTGVDNPIPVVTGPSEDTYDDIVTAQDIGSDLSTLDKEDNATLFGITGMPQITDVEQGVGISSDAVSGVLTALVNRNQNYIKTIIQRRGKRGYRVLLYGDKRPVWVNVDDTLVVTEFGETICNNRVTSDGKLILWPHLICKAMAKLFDKFLPTYQEMPEGYNNLESLTASSVMDIIINQSGEILTPGSDSKETIFGSIVAADTGGFTVITVYTSNLFDQSDAQAPAPANALAPVSTPRKRTAPLGTTFEELDDIDYTSLVRVTPAGGEPFNITSGDTQAVLRVDTAKRRFRMRSPFGAGEQGGMRSSSVTVEYWLPLNALIDLDPYVDTVGYFQVPQFSPALQPTEAPASVSPMLDDESTPVPPMLDDESTPISPMPDEPMMPNENNVPSSYGNFAAILCLTVAITLSTIYYYY